MENWINSKIEKLSSDSGNLFRESLLCYKIKANRASLLFSYLGFLTIIKEVIIKSKKPDSITDRRWEQIIKELNDENKWEDRVFSELNNSTNSIFTISDSVRCQIRYWRGRRNDCAHFKENEINNSHVEIFWSFIRSNLSKITIDGGMNSLLKKIQIHFDIRKTPPGKDYASLIKEIENAVETNQLDEFFKELYQILSSSSSHDLKKMSAFFYSMSIKIERKIYRRKLISFIKLKDNFDLCIMRYHPQFLIGLDYSDEEKREIWTTRIHELNHNSKDIGYWIYSILLRNQAIPENEIKEAMMQFFNSFQQDGYANLPKDDELRKQLSNTELLEIIYDEYFNNGKIFENNIFENNKHLKINSKSDLIELLFEYRTIDLKMVEGICKMYDNGIKPLWLTKNLKDLFKRKPELKSRFIEIIDLNSLEMPNNIN